jgi:hypothetical protein
MVISQATKSFPSAREFSAGKMLNEVIPTEIDFIQEILLIGRKRRPAKFRSPGTNAIVTIFGKICQFSSNQWAFFFTEKEEKKFTNKGLY